MKKYLSLILALTLMLIWAPPAQALEAEITNYGWLNLYQYQVLGQQTAQADNSNSKPFKQVGLGGNRSVQIVPEKMEPVIQVGSDLEDEFEVYEEMADDHIRMTAPAELKDQDQDESQLRNEYQKRIRQARQKRTQEKIEIKSRINQEGSQELDFSSRGVSARLNKATFHLDPDTNEVTLKVSSGKDHVLNHLPDQAIGELGQKGYLTDDLDEVDLEVDIDNQGDTVYRAKTKKNKKFLGLFDRQVDYQVELDDQTGEVNEEKLPKGGLFGNLIDRLSF